MRSNNPNPRQIQLLELVRNLQSASIEQLANTLGVTLQTLRRDVQRLADLGLLVRFHGGVRLPSATVEPLDHSRRTPVQPHIRQGIAQAVARAVPNGCSLMISAAATAGAIARALLEHRDLRIITNDLNAAAILSANSTCELIITCGLVRCADCGVVGEAALDFIGQFRADIAIVGATSIEDDGTLRDTDLCAARLAQAMMRQSRQVWLVAEHRAFRQEAFARLAPLAQIHRLFTDQAPPPAHAALLAEAGVHCTVAGAGTATHTPVSPPPPLPANALAAPCNSSAHGLFAGISPPRQPA